MDRTQETSSPAPSPGVDAEQESQDQHDQAQAYYSDHSDHVHDASFAPEAYFAERAAGLNSFLGRIVGACIVVVVDDDIGSGRNHHIDIEVDTPVLGLAIVDPDPAGDEQLAKAMNLVELVIPLLQVRHGRAAWKKY